jgi:hypothetical protein
VIGLKILVISWSETRLGRGTFDIISRIRRLAGIMKIALRLKMRGNRYRAFYAKL